MCHTRPASSAGGARRLGSDRDSAARCRRTARASRRRPARPRAPKSGAAAPARSVPRAAGAASVLASTSTCALIASAWTPASVRPAAMKRASSPVIRCSASSSVCWTDGPWSCRCQPMNGPPSYSIVSRQRVTAGSCPWELGSRAAARPAVIGAAAGALDLERPDIPSPQAIFKASSSTSPRLPDALAANGGLQQLDPLAIGFEPCAGQRIEGAHLPLDLLGRLATSRSAPRPCRSSTHRSRRPRAAASGGVG